MLPPSEATDVQVPKPLVPPLDRTTPLCYQTHQLHDVQLEHIEHVPNT
jgi:hypothetical protein